MNPRENSQIRMGEGTLPVDEELINELRMKANRIRAKFGNTLPDISYSALQTYMLAEIATSMKEVAAGLSRLNKNLEIVANADDVEDDDSADMLKAALGK